TRQSGHRPARQWPQNAKRPADSVGRPSRKIEVRIVSLDWGYWMQELIYLSDAKLRQFVPAGRRWTRFGRRVTNFRLEAPAGAGGVEVGLAESGTEPRKADQLSDVIKHIEERALWYGDPDARAGRWVYFEAPCNIVVARDTVLFLEASSARGDELGPHGFRLLLHGAANHLLSDVPTADLDPRNIGFHGSALRLAVIQMQYLMHARPEDETDVARSSHYAIGKIMRASDRSPESAAWVRGYARVTLAASTKPSHDQPPAQATVVATPLYVEYAHDLPE
ncbi:SAVMC3_10250 family protein, partial [Streptomyces turgidiscabies]